ncbi:MAG: deoxyribose-phosphate aldolase [Planctomycetota bacterium]|jgi:deoxyribose-phosphate aldolase
MDIQTDITKKQLAGCIDHTLLNVATTEEQIEQHCRQAEDFGFYSVFVLPRWAGFAADLLAGGKVKLGSVVSFPQGAETTKIKVTQTNEMIVAGVNEIDMVADLSAILQKQRRYLFGQLQAVAKICHAARPTVVLKVIIEATIFDEETKKFAIRAAADAGADFIKTSTGFHSAGGATPEDVRLIHQTAPECKVKASGGIRTAGQALAMLAAGADRIGTSSGVEIIRQFEAGRLQ